MAVRLTALSGDMASFYNIRQEYARVALSAVYSVFSISNENTMLIVMAVAFCIGLALGFLLLKLVKLFIIILGGAVGYTLGLAVYAILKDKDLNIEEDHLYYGTLVVCILLCALISLCLVIFLQF